jgi:hypothetical protein
MVTATFGDSIWRQMFPSDFVVAPPGRKRPVFLHYLRAETVLDDDALESLQDWSRQGNSADFAVLHLVGLDHSGHRNGVKNARYAEIVGRTVAHLRQALAAVPSDTTVVLTADHGVTDSGGHGGASPAETQVPFFAYGPGFVPGARVSLHQIDLAPTFACLLGLPIPEGSLGRPAVEALAQIDAERTACLDAGLTGIRHAWKGLAAAPQVAAAFEGNAVGGMPSRLRSYQAVFDAFMASAARARYPLAAWAVVLFLLLLGRERGSEMPRMAVLALSVLLVGALALGIAGMTSTSPLALGLLVIAALLGLLGLRAPRVPADSAQDEAPLVLWTIAAGLALAAALGRDHQRRSTTLLFGSPEPWQLLLAGALLGLGLSARRWWGPAAAARSRRWLAPLLGVLTVEGGEPAIVAGAGVVLGGLLARLIDIAFAYASAVTSAKAAITPAASERRGYRLPVSLALGLIAQTALIVLLLHEMMRHRLLQAGPAAGAAGAALAALCLWLRRPLGLLSARTLAVAAALPLAVVMLASLRSTSLGEHAVRLALLLGLVGLIFLRLAARKPGAAWASLATLVAMWLVLSTPGQRIVIGLALAALFGLLCTEDGAHAPRAQKLLLLAFVAVAWRWSLVGLFEGEFGFGDLEISLAYVGNPERRVVQAGLTIVLKAWLPLAIVLAAADQRGTSGFNFRSLAQALGFVLGLRVVHLAIGIAASPSSFYSVYRLLGELVYEVGLLGGVALAASLSHEWPRSKS